MRRGPLARRGPSGKLLLSYELSRERPDELHVLDKVIKDGNAVVQVGKAEQTFQSPVRCRGKTKSSVGRSSRAAMIRMFAAGIEV